MSSLALSQASQYIFTTENMLKEETRAISVNFTRYDLELRELRTQSREFQKLASRLFSEGYISTSKIVMERRNDVLTRMDELHQFLTQTN